MPSLTPEQVKASLTLDQYKLYKLIWERFTASQMADALLDTVSASIDCGDYTFKASGYSVRFDGFTALYEESKDVPEEKSPGAAGAAAGREAQGQPARPQPALHPAAGKIHRGDHHQGAGGKRHRPPQHLCADLNHRHPSRG